MSDDTYLSIELYLAPDLTTLRPPSQTIMPQLLTHLSLEICKGIPLSLSVDVDVGAHDSV